MRSLTRWLLLAAVMVSCVGCDQVTKAIASRDLRGHAPVRLLGNSIQLRYAENSGGFLSIGADLPQPARSVVFVLVSMFGIAGMLAFAVVGRSPTVHQVLGSALFAAGGLGNLVDRVTRGSTRDFIFVQVGPLHTGIFNVADTAIMAGLCVLLIAFLGKRRHDAADR